MKRALSLMIDAVVGAVIMVVATTSLVFAIEVAEKAFSDSGRYPLHEKETYLLRNSARLNSNQIESFWADNLQNVPREVRVSD